MPTCKLCGQAYPEEMPHSCKGGPRYTQPGLNELDRVVLSDVDVKTVAIDNKVAQSLSDIKAALDALSNNEKAQIWAKNKLLSIEQAIDTLQAAVDLLNEKIP